MTSICANILRSASNLLILMDNTSYFQAARIQNIFLYFKPKMFILYILFLAKMS